MEKNSFQGYDEDQPTNISELADVLYNQADFDYTIDQFDSGNTKVLDVSGMTLRERNLILAYSNAGLAKQLQRDEPELLRKLTYNLNESLMSFDEKHTDNVSMWCEIDEFTSLGVPGALKFRDLVESYTKVPMHKAKKKFDNYLLAQITRQIMAFDKWSEMSIVAEYIANRSLYGERLQRYHYGSLLNPSKMDVLQTSHEIASTTDLDLDMLKRVKQKIVRANFGSLDRLYASPIASHTGSSGKYVHGHLRFDLHFDDNGKEAILLDKDVTVMSISHELHHATSAQARYGAGIQETICGLSIGTQGVSVNEAMTSYLTMLTMNPENEKSTDPDIHEKYGYPVASLAMSILHDMYLAGHNQYFATLFNAYYGDIKSKDELQEALSVYYSLENEVSKEFFRD